DVDPAALGRSRRAPAGRASVGSGAGARAARVPPSDPDRFRRLPGAPVDVAPAAPVAGPRRDRVSLAQGAAMDRPVVPPHEPPRQSPVGRAPALPGALR